MDTTGTMERGFTLIELSIVLVIIGLIVGGVLTGRDLIKAAEVRGTITQIEKFNTAANTFRGKYSYLPGDIKDPDASSFGFQPRGQNAGEGDGNGVVEGNHGDVAGQNFGWVESTGETVTFWVDLSTARLVEGFTGASPTGLVCPPANCSGLYSIDQVLPSAKLGGGNYFYVWSNNSINYFGLSAVSAISDFAIQSTPTLTVQQASQIDKKIDDGFPLLGRVTAQYNNQVAWNNSFQWAGTASSSVAVSGSPSTCYDNAGSASSQVNYSVKQNNGANPNCALSIQFQ